MADYCPRCATELDEDGVWFFNGRFYCSETCCKVAANGG